MGTSQRVAVLESTRLLLVINSYLNTDVPLRIEAFRRSGGTQIECLMDTARQIATYREMGMYHGTRVAAQDVLGSAVGIGSTASGFIVSSTWRFVSQPFD